MYSGMSSRDVMSASLAGGGLGAVAGLGNEALGRILTRMAGPRFEPRRWARDQDPHRVNSALKVAPLGLSVLASRLLVPHLMKKEATLGKLVAPVVKALGRGISAPVGPSRGLASFPNYTAMRALRKRVPVFVDTPSLLRQPDIAAAYFGRGSVRPYVKSPITVHSTNPFTERQLAPPFTATSSYGPYISLRGSASRGTRRHELAHLYQDFLPRNAMQRFATAAPKPPDVFRPTFVEGVRSLAGETDARIVEYGSAVKGVLAMLRDAPGYTFNGAGHFRLPYALASLPLVGAASGAIAAAGTGVKKFHDFLFSPETRQRVHAIFRAPISKQ